MFYFNTMPRERTSAVLYKRCWHRLRDYRQQPSLLLAFTISGGHPPAVTHIEEVDLVHHQPVTRKLIRQPLEDVSLLTSAHRPLPDILRVVEQVKELERTAHAQSTTCDVERSVEPLCVGRKRVDAAGAVAVVDGVLHTCNTWRVSIRCHLLTLCL